MNKNQVDSLLKEGIFPDNDSEKKLIETGISWIILGAKYAYKIKKPVRFSFLDFSSLAKRKFYCEEELRLNRRLTKDIYLNVLPIYKNEATFQIGEQSGGNPVDYLVQMKKMNLAKEMDYMLLKNQVTREHIRTLALKIYRFHETSERIYREFNERALNENFEDILSVKTFVEKYLGISVSEKIDFSIHVSGDFIRKNKALFQERIKEGFVRDCHGDMHSRNIFLYKDPVIFDCIEFSPLLRQMDVLNEIAFLCMDLEAFKRSDLSHYFLKNYYPHKINKELLQLFVFYKCLRANIRAKVHALQAMQEENAGAGRESVNKIAQYVALMYSYATWLKRT